MLFSRSKTTSVAPGEALPGRADALPDVPEIHAVNGNRIQPPFPAGVETAVCMPSGNGGWMRLPLTAWTSGTCGSGSGRPGSASSADTGWVFVREKIIVQA